MLRLTLDHNCLCAVEDACPEATDVLALKRLHDVGHICVQFVCITAFERPRGGDISTVAEFRARLHAAGLAGAKNVETIGYVDMDIP